jgi:hypothetical protein
MQVFAYFCQNILRMLHQAKGKVVFNSFEGGFWGLETDDGRKLRPIDGLPEAFRHSDLKVEFDYRESSSFSFSMWGESIDLVSIHTV